MLDADIPDGTSVSIGVVSHGNPDQNPAESRWRTLPSGTTDATIPQPPARFLTVEVRLHGDGFRTPTVRSLQVVTDALNTIDLLPAVFQSEPASTDFLRRFLAIADAELDVMDAA